MLEDKMILFGVVERRLFNTERLHEVEAKIAANPSMSEEEKKALYDYAAKKMFKENLLWKILKKLLSVDLQIPYITGNFVSSAISHNLIVNTGLKKVADQLGGTTTAPVTAVAIGIGTVAAAATDTALGSEITTGGGARGAATVTNTTTTTTGDTEQWVKTFSFTSSFAVTEEGLFDNNVSGGIMLSRQVFAAVNVVNGDSLQITHKVQA